MKPKWQHEIFVPGIDDRLHWRYMLKIRTSRAHTKFMKRSRRISSSKEIPMQPRDFVLLTHGAFREEIQGRTAPQKIVYFLSATLKDGFSFLNERAARQIRMLSRPKPSQSQTARLPEAILSSQPRVLKSVDFRGQKADEGG
jgi:hypothetical protein